MDTKDNAVDNQDRAVGEAARPSSIDVKVKAYAANLLSRSALLLTLPHETKLQVVKNIVTSTTSNVEREDSSSCTHKLLVCVDTSVSMRGHPADLAREALFTLLGPILVDDQKSPPSSRRHQFLRKNTSVDLILFDTEPALFPNITSRKQVEDILSDKDNSREMYRNGTVFDALLAHLHADIEQFVGVSWRRGVPFPTVSVVIISDGRDWYPTELLKDVSNSSLWALRRFIRDTVPRGDGVAAVKGSSAGGDGGGVSGPGAFGAAVQIHALDVSADGLGYELLKALAQTGNIEGHVSELGCKEATERAVCVKEILTQVFPGVEEWDVRDPLNPDSADSHQKHDHVGKDIDDSSSRGSQTDGTSDDTVVGNNLLFALLVRTTNSSASASDNIRLPMHFSLADAQVGLATLPPQTKLEDIADLRLSIVRPDTGTQVSIPIEYEELSNPWIKVGRRTEVSALLGLKLCDAAINELADSVFAFYQPEMIPTSSEIKQCKTAMAGIDEAINEIFRAPLIVRSSTTPADSNPPSPRPASPAPSTHSACSNESDKGSVLTALSADLANLSPSALLTNEAKVHRCEELKHLLNELRIRFAELALGGSETEYSRVGLSRMRVSEWQALSYKSPTRFMDVVADRAKSNTATQMRTDVRISEIVQTVIRPATDHHRNIYDTRDPAPPHQENEKEAPLVMPEHLKDVRCISTWLDFIEILRDNDCMCITLDVRRPSDATIVDPAQITVTRVGPSFMSADAFMDTLKIALRQNRGNSLAVSGGFGLNTTTSTGLPPAVVFGLGREAITGIFPVFFTPLHWKSAKHRLPEILGWMCTLNGLGYDRAQKEIVPFKVLSAAVTQFSESSGSEHGRHILRVVLETCVAIYREDERIREECMRAFAEVFGGHVVGKPRVGGDIPPRVSQNSGTFASPSKDPKDLLARLLCAILCGDLPHLLHHTTQNDPDASFAFQTALNEIVFRFVAHSIQSGTIKTKLSELMTDAAATGAMYTAGLILKPGTAADWKARLLITLSQMLGIDLQTLVVDPVQEYADYWQKLKVQEREEEEDKKYGKASWAEMFLACNPRPVTNEGESTAIRAEQPKKVAKPVNQKLTAVSLKYTFDRSHFKMTPEADEFMDEVIEKATCSSGVTALIGLIDLLHEATATSNIIDVPDSKDVKGGDVTAEKCSGSDSEQMVSSVDPFARITRLVDWCALRIRESTSTPASSVDSLSSSSTSGESASANPQSNSRSRLASILQVAPREELLLYLLQAQADADGWAPGGEYELYDGDECAELLSRGKIEPSTWIWTTTSPPDAVSAPTEDEKPVPSMSEPAERYLATLFLVVVNSLRKIYHDNKKSKSRGNRDDHVSINYHLAFDFVRTESLIEAAGMLKFGCIFRGREVFKDYHELLTRDPCVQFQSSHIRVQKLAMLVRGKYRGIRLFSDGRRVWGENGLESEEAKKKKKQELLVWRASKKNIHRFWVGHKGRAVKMDVWMALFPHRLDYLVTRANLDQAKWTDGTGTEIWALE
ncbi:hypothetical protein HK102_004257 [Quaeritorhiza haematococci]|nr:hypothetical protein HK102_004257 [Quaeritorhiza haematococci]